MLTGLVVLEFETSFLYCKGTLCPSGSGSSARIGDCSFSVSLAREMLILQAQRRELCLCLKRALSKEEMCVYTRVAGEELEIGLTSCSMLKHILPLGPAHARASAQNGRGPFLHLCKGTRGCPSRKVVCAGGSDLCRTNDPGNQVSPAPGCIYTQMHLAALTQGSGYVTGSGRSSSCGLLWPAGTRRLPRGD